MDRSMTYLSFPSLCLVPHKCHALLSNNAVHRESVFSMRVDFRSAVQG